MVERHFDRALEILNSALAQHPADYHLWTLRGRVLFSMNRQADALEAYRHAIRLQPSCIPALEGAAEIEYDSGNARAEETLGRIVTLEPENQPAHAMLAELAYERHDCKDAVVHFGRAPNPVNQKPEALQQFGACLFKLNQPERAAAMFGRAVALDPANTDAAFDLGLSLLEAKRPAEAIDALRPLANTPVPESDVLNLLGEAYESAHQTPEAITVLRRAVELYPEDPQNYQFLASVCVKHYAYGIAGEVLDAGIVRLPASATLRTMRGLVFMLTGQKRDAEQSFNEATQLAPQDSYGRLGMGIALSFSGEAKDSANVLRAQLARNPKDADANYFLAQVLLQQSSEPGTPKFEEARAALRKALAAKPDFIQARFLEAKIDLQLHHDSDAIANLERTVELDPTFGNAIYLLLQAYARTGRKEVAEKLAIRLHDIMASQLAGQGHTVLLVKTPVDGAAQK
jgi:cytochrome c-type biogenesis protein CcmH/NrfG